MIIMDFIIPITLLVVGYFLKKRPYTIIGSNAYSKPNSKKVQKAWENMQKIVPKIITSYGIILTFAIAILQVVARIINIPYSKVHLISSGLDCTAIIFTFLTVEKKLKDNLG